MWEPNIVKKVYKNNENMGIVNESTQFYYKIARKYGIMNPSIIRNFEIKIRAGEYKEKTEKEICYEGELEYGKNKENFNAAYEMYDFVNYDSFCKWNIKQTLLGIKLEKINLYSICEKCLKQLNFADKITVLIICAKGMKNIRKTLRSVNKIFEKNLDFTGKIRLCFIYQSLHFLSNYYENFEEAGAKFGEQYCFDWKNQNILNLSIEDKMEPVLTIVSQKGIVLVNENFNNITAEEKIRLVMKKGEEIIKMQESINVKFIGSTEENLKILKNKVIDYLIELPNFEKYKKKLHGVFSFSEQYNPKEQTWEYKEGILNLNLDDLRNYENKTKIILNIQELLKNRINFILPLNSYENTNFKKYQKPTNCSKCNANIIKAEYFTCMNCKPNQYFCFNCGINIKTGEKSHIHSLIYVPEDISAQEFEEIKFDNAQKQLIKSNGYTNVHRLCKCEYCGIEPIMGTRWCCANCDQIGESQLDLCDKCFRISKEENTRESEQMHDNLMNVGHDTYSHTYIRYDLTFP